MNAGDILLVIITLVCCYVIYLLSEKHTAKLKYSIKEIINS